MLLAVYAVVLSVVPGWTAYLYLTPETSDGLYSLWQTVLTYPIGVVVLFAPVGGTADIALTYVAGLLQSLLVWATLRHLTWGRAPASVA